MSLPTPRPPWCYRQSGVIAYRHGAGGLEVLLVTSRKRKRWVIPKGIVEPGLSAGASAAKEAHEEAGVAGVLSARPIGSFRYRKWHGECHVAVFLLRVDELCADWPEAPLRQRCWLAASDAAARVREPGLQALLGGLERLMAEHGPDGAQAH